MSFLKFMFGLDNTAANNLIGSNGNNKNEPSNLKTTAQTAVAAGVTAVSDTVDNVANALSGNNSGKAAAANKRIPSRSGAASEVGSFNAGGMLFKDTVKVIAVSDPKVDGVVCHVSYMERALNPFSDPSGSSCSCVRVADRLQFATDRRSGDAIDTSVNGEEVFSASKNLLFKQLKVRRLYDAQNHSLIYVSYTDRLSVGDAEKRGDRFKTSVSNVPLNENEKVY